MLQSSIEKRASSSPFPPPSRDEARKRTYTTLDEATDRPRKVAKLSGEQRIKELETQVRELQEFIIEKGFAYEAPPSILKQLDAYDGIEQILSDALRKQIHDTWEPLYQETLLGKKANVTGDTISEAVCKYIPDIEDLSKRPRGLRLALDLIILLGQHSYGCPDYLEYGKGNRPSDAPADKLLVDILRRMKAKDVDFKPVEEFDTLRRESKRFRMHGNKQHFRRSLQLIWSWIKPQESPKVEETLKQ